MNVMMSGPHWPTINFAPDDGAGSGGAPGGDTPPAGATPPSGDTPPADPPATPPATPPADPPATPPAGQEPPKDPPAASPWGEMDDELKEFVGDKSPADVAKELKGAQTLLGKKQIGIPNEESTPVEWAKFHETRGVPGNAEGYDFSSVKDEVLKDIPEDQREGAWDEGEEKRFRELAKAANLSKTEASELLKRELGYRMEAQGKVAKESADAAKAAQDMITENWGNRTEEYTQDANNFARHMGLGDDVIGAMQKLAGVNAEARFKLVDFMREQGALLREGGQPGKTSGGAVPASGMSADQARQAKTQYLAQGDNQKAYMDPTHPNHQSVTDQVTQYLRAERGIK